MYDTIDQCLILKVGVISYGTSFSWIQPRIY